MMRWIPIVLMVVLLAGCATPRKAEYMAILGTSVTGVEMDGEELKFVYMVHVTKNIRSVRVYYDWWEGEWVRIDYAWAMTIPKHVSKRAQYRVGVGDTLRVNSTQGKIRTTIIASNSPGTRDGEFGQSVRAGEVLDLGEIYSEWVASR